MISIDLLRSALWLDEDTGFLYRAINGVPRIPLSRAGGMGTGGYRRVWAGGRYHKEHRVVWALVHGVWPDGLIDHINRVPSDNRPCNLRLATYSQNNANVSPVGGSSIFKGVSWHKSSRCWRAQIKFGGRKIHIGGFLAEVDAAVAYDAKAAELFGEFAVLNFAYEGAA